MLVAEDPSVCDGLLVQSYPLHPPGRPDQLRTEHLPQLMRPAFFVHGTKDPFGSIEELTVALDLIPARHELHVMQGAAHDLKRGKDVSFCAAFVAFLGVGDAHNG
jgi:predicted alpha/beta-hydrolase family hydrolase